MLNKTEIILPAPDDFHVHLRDGAVLARTVRDVANQCARALIMPNLQPPIDNLAALQSYRQRIVANVPQDVAFTPLMSLYLSDNLSENTLLQARAAGVVAVKWYPKGATTNSQQGIADVNAIFPMLQLMQEQQLLLLIHGEVTSANVDIFDREANFVRGVLPQIIKNFPNLKIVLEHITTRCAVDFVRAQNKNLAATITAHHLLFNRNALLVGGIKPHFYCLPILKSEDDRQSLIAAATSGDARFFLGTDSAPHERRDKENACGCAGCYTAHASMAMYAQVFADVDRLRYLKDFSAYFGAQFYDLDVNKGEMLISQKEQIFPENLTFGSGSVVPFLAGCKWQWSACRV